MNLNERIVDACKIEVSGFSTAKAYMEKGYRLAIEELLGSEDVLNDPWSIQPIHVKAVASYLESLLEEK